MADRRSSQSSNYSRAEEPTKEQQVVITPKSQISRASSMNESFAGVIGEDLDAPSDNYNVTLIIFLLWGMCLLQGEQAMISAMSYFEEQMPSHEPVNYYTFALYAPQCLAIIWVDLYGGSYSYNLRISLGLFISACCTMAIPFLAGAGDSLGFWLCYADLLVFGWFCGVFQGSAFSLAAQFPSKYIATIILGVSMSGLTSNMFRGISFLLKFETLRANTIFFYCISTGFYLFCACAFNFVLLNNNYFKFYFAKIQRINVTANDDEFQNIDDQPVAAVQADEDAPEEVNSLGGWLQAVANQFTMTKGLYYALFFCFSLTFTLFPPSVFATTLTITDKMADPVTMFQFIMLIVYNVGDLSGRMVGGCAWSMIGRMPTIVGIYCRVIFFGTFIAIMFNCGPAWLFGADWFKILNTVLLGFTNGYLSTLCAILAPTYVPEKHRQQCGSLITAAITFGITVGAVLQVPMGFLIQASPNGNHVITAEPEYSY